jgi:hypothetical protein
VEAIMTDIPKVSFEFDVTDLPMLAHALMIARNTAMMCGNKQAEARLESLRECVDALIPEGALVLDAFDWAEIGMALPKAQEVEVRIDKASWRGSWYREGHITVDVDGKTWSTNCSSFFPDGKEIEAVREVIGQLWQPENTSTFRR